MWRSNKIIKFIFFFPIIFIFFAFFLHALQVPHHHFIALEMTEHHQHHPLGDESKSHSVPGVLFDLPDYLHGSDKKDILILLLAMAALAGVVQLSWPINKVLLQTIEYFNPVVSTKKILFVSYLESLFSLGILNPKIH